MTADHMMSEDRSDLTLAILTDIFKTQMSLVTSCVKASLAEETKMSHAIDPATTGLATLLDPVAECFTPEIACALLNRRRELGRPQSYRVN